MTLETKAGLCFGIHNSQSKQTFSGVRMTNFKYFITKGVNDDTAMRL